MKFRQLMNEFWKSRGLRFEAHTRPRTSLTGGGFPPIKILASKTVFLSCDGTVGCCCCDGVGCDDVDDGDVAVGGLFAPQPLQPHAADPAVQGWVGVGSGWGRVAPGQMVPVEVAHLEVVFLVECSYVG